MFKIKTTTNINYNPLKKIETEEKEQKKNKNR